jgi:uncharacterized protein yukE
MANQIRMTPDSMRARAGEYQHQSEIVGDVITTMDNLLEQLQSEWEGAASEAYAEKYEELKPGFISMQDLIADICNALNKTADAVEQTDSDIASQFRA